MQSWEVIVQVQKEGYSKRVICVSANSQEEAEQKALACYTRLLVVSSSRKVASSQ